MSTLLALCWKHLKKNVVYVNSMLATLNMRNYMQSVGQDPTTGLENATEMRFQPPRASITAFVESDAGLDQNQQVCLDRGEV